MIYYKNSSELYHHGILGQKWGVRRYQNKDGTLTEAGKKRISKTYENAFDSYDKYRRSKKRIYAVDEHGNNRYDDQGNGRFDASGGIAMRNKKLEKDAVKNSRALIEFEEQLKKEFDSVKITDGRFDLDTGKAKVHMILEKDGAKSIVEFAKDYGVFIEPIEFKTYSEYAKK